MSKRPPLKRTFDVSREDPIRFEEFIRELRDALIRELPSTSRAPPLRNLPSDLYVLAPQERRPRQWLQLTMVDHNDAIILWIRTDNLYLVGFEQPPRTGQAAGRRYEFNNSTSAADPNHSEKNATKNNGGQSREPLIPGASFMGIEGRYDAIGLRVEFLDSIQFGYNQLVQAIHGLATYVRGAAGGIGIDHLRTMVVTISESLRLRVISEFIGNLLSSYTQRPLPPLFFSYIQHWGSISTCVIRSANNETAGDVYSNLRNKCQIENTEQACLVVAMLLRENKNSDDDDDDDKKKKGKSRPKRDDEAAALDVPQQAWQGLTFVEIFSAVVSTGRQLYGRIAIDDGFTSQPLFVCRRSDAQPPSADGNVDLTGPARAVWGYDEIVMHVDLMDVVPGVIADMTPDSDEVGSGKLVWNTYDTLGMVYDEVEEYVFDGVSGAVILRCAVITNAVVATVVLRRTGTGGSSQEQQVDVYGTVSAATAMFLPRDKVTLFNRERKDAFSVGANEDVQLLRNIAVVPLDSPLVICADLWTRAYVVDMSPDDHISSGAVAVFQPSPFGVFRKVISSNDDYEFEVSVTWSLN